MSDDEDQPTTDHTWCHRKLEILRCLFHRLVDLLHQEMRWLSRPRRFNKVGLFMDLYLSSQVALGSFSWSGERFAAFRNL